MAQRPALLALLAAAVLVAGCPKPAEEPDAPVVAADEAPGADTLVVAVQSDAESFLSVVSQSAADSAIYGNMFLALTDSKFDCRIIAPPELAESIEHPEDGLSITYRIRPEAVWSDGTPITAADVVFTYDLVADPAVASPRMPYIEHMKPDARPRVIDDRTVRFEFTHAYDRQSQLAHTGLNLLPKHALESVPRGSLRECEFNSNPIVSGPFKIGSWKKGSTLELVPNPAYTGTDKTSLARVIFKVIPEYATRIIELENGSVDLIESFQVLEDVPRIQARKDMTIHRRGYRFMDYLGWNLRNPMFQDRSVRQALTMAINREKIIADLLTLPSGERVAVEATSWITPELCDFRDDTIKPLPFDPGRAREMLAAAGWADTNADGLLDKGGKPFRFKLLTNAGNARRAKAVIIIQSNLKAIGVDAQLEQIESNQFFERLRKKDFECALSGWSAGLFVDPTDLWHSDTPEKKHEFNFCSYSNPRADELIDAGMKAVTVEEQAPIWRELQQVIYDDQPYTFLYWRDELVPLHSRFRNASVNMLAYIDHLSEWEVPASQVKYKY